MSHLPCLGHHIFHQVPALGTSMKLRALQRHLRGPASFLQVKVDCGASIFRAPLFEMNFPFISQQNRMMQLDWASPPVLVASPRCGYTIAPGAKGLAASANTSITGLRAPPGWWSGASLKVVRNIPTATTHPASPLTCSHPCAGQHV